MLHPIFSAVLPIHLYCVSFIPVDQFLFCLLTCTTLVCYQAPIPVYCLVTFISLVWYRLPELLVYQFRTSPLHYSDTTEGIVWTRFHRASWGVYIWHRWLLLPIHFSSTVLNALGTDNTNTNHKRQHNTVNRQYQLHEHDTWRFNWKHVPYTMLWKHTQI